MAHHLLDHTTNFWCVMWCNINYKCALDSDADVRQWTNDKIGTKKKLVWDERTHLAFTSESNINCKQFIPISISRWESVSYSAKIKHSESCATRPFTRPRFRQCVPCTSILKTSRWSTRTSVETIWNRDADLYSRYYVLCALRPCSCWFGDDWIAVKCIVSETFMPKSIPINQQVSQHYYDDMFSYTLRRKKKNQFRCLCSYVPLSLVLAFIWSTFAVLLI